MKNNIPWWNVNIGEDAVEAVSRAVRDRNLSMGKIAQAFEQRIAEMLGVRHVVAVTSGTSALMLALLEAGVGPGTEVIVPDRTWIASAHAPLLLGAKVVLTDVDPQHTTLCPDAMAAAITPRTRAVIPVHLNGRACDMPRIHALAERHGITVIEDGAQALFSRDAEGRFLGTRSHSGCFSLSVAKIITSGQGGFVVTSSDHTAERLRLMRTHGTSDVFKPTWLMAGGNFRYTDILAAVALTQLDKLDARLKGVRETCRWYTETLPPDSADFRLQYRDPDGHEVPLYVEAYCSQRDELVAFLLERGIQCRPLYQSLHCAPQLAGQTGTFPHADALGQRGFFLPSGTDRSREEIDTVTEAIRHWLEAHTAHC